MMRVLAVLMTLVLLAGAVLAGQGLWQVLEAPLPDMDPEVATGQNISPAPPRARTLAPPARWPALFGTLVVPEPQPPAPPTPPEPEPEPQPPAPPAPPVESLGYQLKGVMSDGDTRWALVSHPTGEKILRVGDALNAQYVVIAIDADGLWVAATVDGPKSLLGFVK